MNYIVLDLEWNQSPNGKEYSIAGMPFEIIQIGAVKVNGDLQPVDEYERWIKPKEYMQLHSKVQEILGVTMEELIEKGSDFQEVIKDFLEWCGDDYLFCTWGSADLTELQRNMNYYGIDNNFPKPFLFYDLQKLFSICFLDGKARTTLQHAIEYLDIKSDEEYHFALNDARYTAMILEKIDLDAVGKFYNVDMYRIPKSVKDEIFLDFGEYCKYISRGFYKKDAALVDRNVRSCKCFKCGKNMKKIHKWFATNSKSYYGLFECEEHGLVKGRFKVKQADNKKYYVVKIMKLTDKEGAQKISERKVHETEHRRMKRHKED